MAAPPVETDSDSGDEGGLALPEFFIILWQPLGNTLRLPDRIGVLLEGREPESFILQLERCPQRIEAVVFRHHSHMFLGNGWATFTRMHQLQLQQSWMLTFCYAGTGKLRIKMHDANCLRHPCCTDSEAPHGEEGSDGEEDHADDNE